MDRRTITDSIKGWALEIGFDLVGVAPVGPFPESQFYKVWLDRGYEGEMAYMARDPEKRSSAANLLKGAKSVISCALNYNTDLPYSTDCSGDCSGDSSGPCSEQGRGWISRYAWGEDYHDIITKMLSELDARIREGAARSIDTKIYVDTGPVLDKVYAKYSGIGWIGKNTCIINQQAGSWLFIGELITDLELEYDTPPPDRCGSCTRCIDACPTDAIVDPYVLDSNLCVSYLTIELKGGIPVELREGVGANVYGCDICQDVCPWNRKAAVTESKDFLPKDSPRDSPRESELSLFMPDLDKLASLSPEDFRTVFRKSPIKRTKRRGLLRNAAVAMGNSGLAKFSTVLDVLLADEEPLVRAHAAWALWKLGGRGAKNALESSLGNEQDELVIEEIKGILSKIASSQSQVELTD